MLDDLLAIIVLLLFLLLLGFVVARYLLSNNKTNSIIDVIGMSIFLGLLLFSVLVSILIYVDVSTYVPYALVMFIVVILYFIEPKIPLHVNYLDYRELIVGFILVLGVVVLYLSGAHFYGDAHYHLSVINNIVQSGRINVEGFRFYKDGAFDPIYFSNVYHILIGSVASILSLPGYVVWKVAPVLIYVISICAVWSISLWLPGAKTTAVVAVVLLFIDRVLFGGFYLYRVSYPSMLAIYLLPIYLSCIFYYFEKRAAAGFIIGVLILTFSINIHPSSLPVLYLLIGALAIVTLLTGKREIFICITKILFTATVCVIPLLVIRLSYTRSANWSLDGFLNYPANKESIIWLSDNLFIFSPAILWPLSVLYILSSIWLLIFYRKNISLPVLVICMGSIVLIGIVLNPIISPLISYFISPSLVRRLPGSFSMLLYPALAVLVYSVKNRINVKSGYTAVFSVSIALFAVAHAPSFKNDWITTYRLLKHAKYGYAVKAKSIIKILNEHCPPGSVVLADWPTSIHYIAPFSSFSTVPMRWYRPQRAIPQIRNNILALDFFRNDVFSKDNMDFIKEFNVDFILMNRNAAFPVETEAGEKKWVKAGEDYEQQLNRFEKASSIFEPIYREAGLVLYKVKLH